MCDIVLVGAVDAGSTPATSTKSIFVKRRQLGRILESYSANGSSTGIILNVLGVHGPYGENVSMGVFLDSTGYTEAQRTTRLAT